MARLLLLALLGACSAPRASLGTQNNCGVKLLMSTWLTESALREAIEAATEVATSTKDKRLSSAEANCSMLTGYTLQVRPTRTWEMLSSDGTFVQRVSGATYCFQQRIEIGDQVKNQGWKSTALVHEFFHAMQDCVTPKPTDVDQDDDHSNWSRDGIMQAILKAEDWL